MHCKVGGGIFGLIALMLLDTSINMAMQPLYSSLGGERAGLGFSVMQSFTDDMSVRSKLGAGTTVILTKRISVRLSDATRQR